MATHNVAPVLEIIFLRLCYNVLGSSYLRHRQKRGVLPALVKSLHWLLSVESCPRDQH